MKEDFLILIGSGPVNQKTIAVVRRKLSNLKIIQVSYGKKEESVNDALYFSPDEDYINKINEVVGDGKIVGVVNRFDSYILLYGKLVDEYSLHGSSYESVLISRDKTLFHEKMIEMGLDQFRPNSTIMTLREFEGNYERAFPYVVKPSMGAKSRGVFVVRSRDDYVRARGYLKDHYKKSKYYRGYEAEARVIIEEYIDRGKQMTITCYVDDGSELIDMQFVDVLTGKDVGQDHQQLVYRSTPSIIDSAAMTKAKSVISEFAKGSGLKSVFLHPEFMVVDDRIFLIEVNVRVGGFRSELYRYTTNEDIDEMVIKLALGEKIANPSYAGEIGCCAVEVWEEKSGELIKFEINDEVEGFKQYIEVGDDYVAPPLAQIPISRFYVTGQGEQLSKAKRIRDNIEIEIK